MSFPSTSEKPEDLVDGAIFAALSMSLMALALMTPLTSEFSVPERRFLERAIASVSHDGESVGPQPDG